MEGRILIVDDEAPIRIALRRVLISLGFEVDCAADGPEGLNYLRNHGPYDLALLDIKIPGGNGFELLKEARRIDPIMSVLMITGYATVETAVRALRCGALDYLTKPFDNIFEVCEHTIQNAVKDVRRRRMRNGGGVRRGEDGAYEGLLGKSHAMLRFFEELESSVNSEFPVVIFGETGAGKTLAARAIHTRSRRSDKPLYAINCAVLPEEEIERALFGDPYSGPSVEGGVPQGVLKRRRGGTLLLDEISEMPLELQKRLLMALEENDARRANERLRVIATSRQNLQRACDLNLFLTDLLYRLSVLTIQIPPLRERQGDVLLLANHFLQDLLSRRGGKVKRFSRETLEILENGRWNGNVRELRNTVERSVLFASGEELLPRDLPEGLTRPAEELLLSGFSPGLVKMDYADAKQRIVADFEQRYLAAVMEKTGGNISQAARVAGMDRSNFRRLLKRHRVQSAHHTQG